MSKMWRNNIWEMQALLNAIEATDVTERILQHLTEIKHLTQEVEKILREEANTIFTPGGEE